MSDFIKVNFMYGHVRVVNKNDLELYAYDRFNVYFAQTKYAKQRKDAKDSSDTSHLEEAQIFKEEYDRLCKELGVE